MRSVDFSNSNKQQDCAEDSIAANSDEEHFSYNLINRTDYAYACKDDRSHTM